MSATIKTTAWKPTMVRRVIRVIKSSTCPIECELDDGEHAFVKVLGNAEGASALACEFIEPPRDLRRLGGVSQAAIA